MKPAKKNNNNCKKGRNKNKESMYWKEYKIIRKKERNEKKESMCGTESK